MSTTNNAKRTEVSKSALTLDKLSVTEYQKAGTITAQVRQVVTTKSYYPSKRVDNDKQQNIFAAADFGFEEQEFTSTENRMAFLPVPQNSTEAQIQSLLDAASAKGACIYRALSNRPILSTDQVYSIEQGQKSLDDYANVQVVRYPKDSKSPAGMDISGQIILDAAGNVTYRRTYFWNSPKEDEVITAPTGYMSPEIKIELSGASVVNGQMLL